MAQNEKCDDAEITMFFRSTVAKQMVSTKLAEYTSIRKLAISSIKAGNLFVNE